MKRLISVSVCFLASYSYLVSSDKFEGTIEATLTRGGATSAHFVFTCKGDRVRIEDATNKLEPINLIDLANNKLTVVYPHNTTFVVVDLNKVANERPAAPMPSTFFPPNLSTPVQPSARAGPSISPPPGFASRPQMPSMPAMPKNMSGAGGSPAMMMPMPPPMMPPQGATELTVSDKTKKLLGYDCTLYTVSDRGETLEIWATKDGSLFPFRLITRDYLGHRFGPPMIEERWPNLLRDKSLFPLEADLKTQPGEQERLKFAVDKIDRRKVDNEKLFQPPEKYLEIQAPQF